MVIKEDRGWWAEETKPLEQRFVVSVVRRHIGPQQLHAGQLVGDPGIVEGEAIHLLARDAPVGVEVEYRRLAPCVRERRIELVDALDATPGQRFRLRGARTRGQPFQRPQYVAPP